MGEIVITGGFTQFAKWPPEEGDDSKARLRGLLLGIWRGQYGRNAQIYVVEAENLFVPVLDEDGEETDELVEVEPGEIVNTSLGYRAFDVLKRKHEGLYLDISFVGWGDAKRKGQHPPRRWRWKAERPEADDPVLELLEDDDFEEGDDLKDE